MSEEPVVLRQDLPAGCRDWDSPLALPFTDAAVLPRHPQPWVFHKDLFGLRMQLATRRNTYYRPVCFRGVPLYYPNFLALMPAEVLRKIESMEPPELTELKRTFGKRSVAFLAPPEMPRGRMRLRFE